MEQTRLTDVNAILARIQKGESAEDIANEFANIVNEAVKLNDAQTQERKRKEDAAAREELLNLKAKDILTAINAYVQAANPELAQQLDIDEVYDVADIRKMIDATLAGVALSLSFAEKLADPTPAPKQPESADETIANFLKMFVN